MEYFSNLLSRWDRPAPVEILWLHRSLALPSRNTPWKFQLDTYKTFENIAGTWTLPQIKANGPALPISDLYFTWFWLINVAKLYMYLPAYLPGVSILVCSVYVKYECQISHGYPSTWLTGQVSVSLNVEYFSNLLSRWDWPASVEILWLRRSLALPSRNTPWKFQLDTYKTCENIAVTWTPPQIKANWPTRPISDLYFTWYWLINVAKLYMYLPAYLPGVSIQVCRVCMLNMNARYLMVTHLQGLPGRSVFR